MEIERLVGFDISGNQNTDYQVGEDECPSPFVYCFDWVATDSTQGYYLKGFREKPTLNQAELNVRAVCKDLGFSGVEQINACQEQVVFFAGPTFDDRGNFNGVDRHSNNLGDGTLAGDFELNFPAYDCGLTHCVNIAGKEVTIDQLHGVIVDNSSDVAAGKEPQVMYDPSCASVLIAPLALAAALAPRIRSFYHKIRSKFSPK